MLCFSASPTQKKPSSSQITSSVFMVLLVSVVFLLKWQWQTNIQGDYKRHYNVDLLFSMEVFVLRDCCRLEMDVRWL